MFNQRILKAALVAAWGLVLFAAWHYSREPWDISPTLGWLAGFTLGATYALCGIVFGTTDHEMYAKMTKAMDLDRDALRIAIDQAYSAAKNADAAANRVSAAISELRSSDRL